ncbi:MAG: hypothetical protein ACTSPE_13085 [Candidatus Thorarchaeota archaeon]
MPQHYIYWEDPLESEFRVTVTSCRQTERGYEITIDEHVARPEGGGQAGDRGTLEVGGAIVRFVDTVEDNGSVVLICEGPVEVGAEASLKIDMQWRRSMMRNHSAEHLFVASMKRVHEGVELGYIWIDGDHGTVDVHASDITFDEILRAERMVQDIVAQGLPVHTSYVTRDELDRSVRAREGVAQKHNEIRVVAFGDYDRSACSGTHVLSTGDIGLFKVINCKFHEDKIRVEFLTGESAVRLVSEVFNAVLVRKDSYPFELEQLGPILDRSKRILTERNELVAKVEEMICTNPSWEKVGTAEFLAEYLPGFEPSDLRRIVKRLPLEGACAVLLFSPGRKSNLVFATNDMPREAREYVGPVVEELGGRGGGRGEVYTGGFTDVEDPLSFFDELQRRVRKRVSE